MCVGVCLSVGYLFPGCVCFCACGLGACLLRAVLDFVYSLLHCFCCCLCLLVCVSLTLVCGRLCACVILCYWCFFVRCLRVFARVCVAWVACICCVFFCACAPMRACVRFISGCVCVRDVAVFFVCVCSFVPAWLCLFLLVFVFLPCVCGLDVCVIGCACVIVRAFACVLPFYVRAFMFALCVRAFLWRACLYSRGIAFSAPDCVCAWRLHVWLFVCACGPLCLCVVGV